MNDASSPEPRSSETTAAAPPSSATRTAGQGARLLVDVGPVIVFVVIYNLARRFRPDDAIFIGTGVFIVATLIALGYARLKQKRFPPMLVVSAVIVTLFGGAAIIFRNETFVYIKPTIINLLYAVAIFGSLLVRQNIWKLLFGSVFALPDRIWTILAIRWGLWFVFLAVLNEVIWRNFSEPFWANFKLVGVLPLTFIFALANVPITMKHAIDPDENANDETQKETNPAQ